MGWNVINPQQHHECQLPNYEQRKEAGMGIGTVIECDECGSQWQWEHLSNGSSVAGWFKVRYKC